MAEEILSVEAACPLARTRAARALTEKDAIEIWIARWLRVPRKDLLARYGCNSTRLYEIWWGERFPASRARAADEFSRRYPELTERTVFGYRRIRRSVSGSAPGQADLFG